jgi:3'-5' exoribonuclease
MIIRKKQLIRDMKKEELIDDVFVVKFRKPIEPYKNGYKFELRLADSSKEIMYKYWGPSDEQKVRLLFETIRPDSVVQVQGRVNEWNNQLEISANEQSKVRVLKQGEYDIRDFVRETEKPVEDMYADLLANVASVKDPAIKGILDHFFCDPVFADRFKKSPAAMYKHHGWIGGLLEHTRSVLSICLDIQKVHPGMDRDLLTAGALLHDIGKMDEFTVATSIKVSTEGMLLGHVTIGVQMLTRAMDILKTPRETQHKILHMLITHMGEYGSNRMPSFPEALAVFHADQLDAELLQMSELKDKAQTEDDYIYAKDFGNVYLR